MLVKLVLKLVRGRNKLGGGNANWAVSSAGVRCVSWFVCKRRWGGGTWSWTLQSTVVVLDSLERFVDEGDGVRGCGGAVR